MNNSFIRWNKIRFPFSISITLYLYYMSLSRKNYCFFLILFICNGHAPLWGIGVISLIKLIVMPLSVSAFIQTSLPSPGPFTMTSTLFIPFYFIITYDDINSFKTTHNEYFPCHNITSSLFLPKRYQ